MSSDLLISQGAEGKVYIGQLFDRIVIVKERVSKRYRHKELDQKLNKQRISQEARCMAKCKKIGVRCPAVYHVDLNTYRIYCEYVKGVTIKQLLWNLVKIPEYSNQLFSLQNIADDSNNNTSISEFSSFLQLMRQLCALIGTSIAQLHMEKMLHGDLTTSNIMIQLAEPDEVCMKDTLNREKWNERWLAQVMNVLTAIPTPVSNNSSSSSSCSNAASAVLKLHVVLIDFGIGKMVANVEDMAVDLYVMERAFISTHPGLQGLLVIILTAYQQANTSNGKEVLTKLESVRQRGRKRDMCG